jgi:glutaredoxin domain-containing cysteine-rich protein 1
MGVVRETFQRCLQVQRILGTLLIAYEERDVSMNRQVQQELKERVHRDTVLVPQVFVEGQLLGVSRRDIFINFNMYKTC